MKPRLAIVPLDDRPVNLQALVQLGEVGGVRVSVPPRRLLGRFRTPGLPGALLDWLAETLVGADGAVLSLDMLCLGGLVASRDDAVSEAVALSRLDALRAILARAQVPAVASTVILRQSITVTDESSLARWRRLFELMGLPDDRRAAALSAAHDPGMARDIERHLRCRRRNHAVNRAALQLVADGALGYVAVLKEDCSPEGIHRIEEAELNAARARLGVESRSSIEPGADEGGMMLLARMALAAHRTRADVAVEYLPRRLSETVPLYEDRVLGRTVTSQVRVCGMGERADAPLRLTVVAAVPPGGDLFVAAPGHGAPADHAWPGTAEIVARLLKGGLTERAPAGPRGVAAAAYFGTHPAGDRPPRPARWGLADVGYANGADPALAAALVDAGVARGIDAFGAWNTAANTCGSVLAHLALLSCPGDKKRSERYALTRWIDDYVYQSVVRREILEAARNPYDFGRAGRTLAALLGRRMREECRARLARLGVKDVRARFPWNRAFEVEITGV